MTDKIRDALAQLATDRAAFNAIDLYHSRSWAAARAALAEPPAPSVPSVPREPTPEMFDAALPNGNAWTAGTIWRAMYDAAINDQSGGGAVAPEQAKAEKAGVASGPPDPIAARPDDVVAWTTGTNTPGGQAVIQVADGMQLPPGTNLCLAATLRRERERAEQTALRAQYWKDEHIAANKVIESVEADRDRLAAECERLLAANKDCLAHYADARHDIERLTATNAELASECERLRAALAPFARVEFSTALGGNVEGDASPIYGRNGAVLTLGDFRAAIDAARGMS